MAMSGVQALRVVLVDDHRVLGEGLRLALERDHALAVVGLAGTGGAALELVAHVAPDVVVLDLHLPDLPGLAVARLLRERHSQVAILILTGAEGPSQAAALEAAGVGGYLTKEASVAEVAAAIRAVAAGYHLFPSTPASALPTLTKRERQALAGVLRGQTGAQIAEEHRLSVRTVEWHLANLLGKFRVNSTRELLALALRERLDPTR